MNKTTTKLLTALALLVFMTLNLMGWGQTVPEVVAYTLDGTKTGGTSGYDTESNITQGDISWIVTANTTTNPWRIGGKSITDTDRPVYSTGTIPANVTKIEVTHGTATQIILNSWTVIVATDASFNNVVSTLTPTFTESTTTTIERPSGADWTNCYYKFVYNVTNKSSSSNRYIQFHDAKFYAPAPQLTITPPTGGTIAVTDAENNPVTSGDYLAPYAVLNIVASPNPRYAFGEWAATSGTLGSTNNPFTTLTLGATDATLSAAFVEANLLTFHAEHGTITATDAQSNPVISGNYIASGAVLNIVATPASGYEFAGWTVSGTSSSVNDATTATTTFTMGNANAELTASFTLAQGPIYTFVKTSEIAVGDTVLLIYEGDKKELSNITTSGTTYGQGTTYTTVPAGAYPLTVVQGYSTGTYAFQNSSNAYLYWTSGNSLGINNTLSNNTSWNVSFSDGNATIANAATPTRTIRWNNSNYGGNRFACYTSGQQAVQLYKKVEMHPITITQPADGNGTIAVFDADQNEVATGDFFFEGEVLTIEATPLLGYALDEWTATNGAVGDVYALTTTLTIGTGDVAITASFAADNTQYDVNIAQGITNGSVVADQTSCASGSQVTLTISPDSGYNIETLTVTGNVSGNNIMISPTLSLNETEYTFTMPSEAVTVNGTFTDRVTDELSIALIYPNMTPYGTSPYYNWTVSNKSNAVYAGNSNHTNQYIQLRNNTSTYSGIVSTASGGYVRRVVVSWAGTNTDSRTITVYGKNEPYTGPSDLYNTSTRGTSLGTLTYTTDATSAELEITDDYLYVGLLASDELYINPIQIAWEDPSVSTTIAIDDSGLTNTYIYGDNFAAGSLVATVKDNNGDPISGATVTWSSSNTGIATIANDGTVTLYSPGTTTITATYNGVLCQYKPSTATYVLEVIHPYSVADAIAVAEAGGTSTNVYTHGTVSSFFGTGTTILDDGGHRYFISDDGTTTTQLLVYGGKGLNDVAFSNVNDLLVGDEVIVFGRLTNNGTTPEIAANNYIVSLSRSTTVTIDGTGITNTNYANGTAAGTLVATVTDSQGNAITGASVTWTSSDEGVATINSNGEVTLVATGNVTFTAEYAKNTTNNFTYTASSDTYDLVVIDERTTTVYFETTGINTDLANGEDAGTLVATVTDQFGNPVPSATVTWESDNTSVATINETTGVVTLHGAGTTTITATYAGETINNVTYLGSSYSEDLHVVYTRPTTITIYDNITNNNFANSAPAGSLSAEVKDNTGTTIGTEVTWESDNSSVADIDPVGGYITLNGAGEVTFTATYAGVPGEYAAGTEDFYFVVYQTTVTIDDSQLGNTDLANGTAAGSLSATIVNAGNTVTNSTITWESDDENVATVDENTGAVTLVAAGTTTITATCAEVPNVCASAVATYEITVTESLTTTVTIYDYLWYTNLAEGTDAGTLVAEVKDSNDNLVSGATVTWTSSDEGVATINSNGEVTLVAAGTTTIMATYAGEPGYQVSYGTYDLAVIDISNGDLGSETNPYTVTEAIATTPPIGTTSDVYVRGTVSDIVSILNNADYYITDGTNTLFVPAGNGMGGSSFHNGNDLLVGDEVVIKGGLTTKNNTEQFARSSQIVSLNRTIDGNVTYTDFTINDGETITVKANVTLTLSGTTTIKDDGQLIIEDGGQLIHTGVDNATMKKGVAAASDWENVSDGWYTIASPLATVDLTNDNPLITFTSNYDLYSYIESEHKWYNQKAHTEDFTTLSRGTGYLYANESAVDLAFTGALLATDNKVEVTLDKQSTGDLAGYNLVGNPFSCNISFGKVNLGSDPLTTYYAVTNGSEIKIFTLFETPILPCQGFFVQAANDGDILTFNPSGSKGERASKPAYVCIEAGDANFMDRAYVQIGQGNTLRKMTINDNVAHVYVIQDGQDYAAATIEEAQGEMPVNFVAPEDGTYTMTVKTTLNSQLSTFNYLHLIDNLTGADIDLLFNPSYTFNAKNNDYASRFRLVFSSNSMNDNENDNFAFISNGQIIITEDACDASLQVIDMMGRIVSTHQLNGTQNVSTANLASGVYVLRLVNGTNVKTQKIVK